MMMSILKSIFFSNFLIILIIKVDHLVLTTLSHFNSFLFRNNSTHTLIEIRYITTDITFNYLKLFLIISSLKVAKSTILHEVLVTIISLLVFIFFLTTFLKASSILDL